jgi:hypothetical protein
MWALLHTATVYTEMRSANKKKTNYREQSFLLEASSSVADQDLLYFTHHLKGRFSLHYSQPMVLNLSQINPAHCYQPCSCHNRIDSAILANVWTVRISNPYSGKRIFPTPKHAHWPGLLVSGYRGSIPRVSSRGVK